MKFYVLILAGLLSNAAMATETYTCLVQDCVHMFPEKTNDVCDSYNKFVIVKDHSGDSPGHVDYYSKTKSGVTFTEKGYWREGTLRLDFANQPETEFQIAIYKNGKAVGLMQENGFLISYNTLNLVCTSK